MKKLLFIIMLIIPFLSACSDNRYKEPGYVRNDTIYDVTYVLNQMERKGYDSFEGVAQKADYNLCLDSALIREDAICPEVYEPVCGCDGVTYSNACKATSAGVLKYSDGKCKSE